MSKDDKWYELTRMSHSPWYEAKIVPGAASVQSRSMNAPKFVGKGLAEHKSDAAIKGDKRTKDLLKSIRGIPESDIADLGNFYFVVTKIPSEPSQIIIEYSILNNTPHVIKDVTIICRREDGQIVPGRRDDSDYKHVLQPVQVVTGAVPTDVSYLRQWKVTCGNPIGGNYKFAFKVIWKKGRLPAKFCHTRWMTSTLARSQNAIALPPGLPLPPPP